MWRNAQAAAAIMALTRPKTTNSSGYAAHPFASVMPSALFPDVTMFWTHVCEQEAHACPSTWISQMAFETIMETCGNEDVC